MTLSYSQKLYYDAVEKIKFLYLSGDHPSIIAAKVNLSDLVVNAIIERHFANDKE